MRKDDGKSKVIARDIPVSQKEYKGVALDDIPTLDDIPRVDDFEPPGAACFAKGSKVLMPDGSYKNIEDIKEGDYIAVPNDEPLENYIKINEDYFKIIPDEVVKDDNKLINYINGHTKLVNYLESGFSYYERNNKVYILL